MALRDKITLIDILIGFENTLKIEHKDTDVNKTIKEARQRLESSFGVKLSGDIYKDQIQTQLVGDNIDVLLTQLMESLKSLSLLSCVSMYDKRYGESLRDLDYLGFSETNLKKALKYLQDETLIEKRDSFFTQLVDSISRVDICHTKRLLVILAVLEDIGVKEGVAIVAQYLYLGLR